MNDQSEDSSDFSDTWDSDALVAKAKRYAEKMLEAPRDGWEFALWSSFCLEFLLRADLSDYAPALLADIKDVNNVISASGYPVNVKKFIPKTAATSDVIERLSKVATEFSAELAGFSLRHTSLFTPALMPSKVRSTPHGFRYSIKHANSWRMILAPP